MEKKLKIIIVIIIILIIVTLSIFRFWYISKKYNVYFYLENEYKDITINVTFEIDSEKTQSIQVGPVYRGIPGHKIITEKLTWGEHTIKIFESVKNIHKSKDFNVNSDVFVRIISEDNDIKFLITNEKPVYK